MSIKKCKTASRLVLNEKEIPTLKLIYSKYLELKSLSKLETYLMNNNIKTRKGAYFSSFSLKTILTNPVYVENSKEILDYFKEKGINIYSEKDNRSNFDGKFGFLTYNKTNGRKKLPMDKWIITVGLHPSLITSKEWIAVQMLLEKNVDKKYRAAGFPKKQAIASGLIRCKKCGSYMRPRNMDKRRDNKVVNYRYYCELKEKSRMQKCDCKNVPGNELDESFKNIIKETFVPNSKIYQELKNMSISNNDKNINDELKSLEIEYKKKQDEINKIVEKLQYIDIDLIDVVNNNLRTLKNQLKDLEGRIEKMKSSPKPYEKQKESKTTKNILKIIDNSFETFDKFDLKTKRDIVSLFIESIYGNGEEVEINFLNTQISENQKRIYIPILTKIDNFLNTDLPTDSMSKIAP